MKTDYILTLATTEENYLQTCKELLKTEPNNPSTYIKLGSYLMKHRKYSSSLKAFEFALEFHKRNISLYENLISVSMELKDYNKVSKYSASLIYLLSRLLDRYTSPSTISKIREIVAFRVNLGNHFHQEVFHRKNLEFTLRFGIKDDMIFEELYNNYTRNLDLDNLARLLNAYLNVFHTDQSIKLSNKQGKLRLALKLSLYLNYPGLAKNVIVLFMDYIIENNLIGLLILCVAFYISVGDVDKVKELFTLLEEKLSSENDYEKYVEDFFEMVTAPLYFNLPYMSTLVSSHIERFSMLYNNNQRRIEVVKLYLEVIAKNDIPRLCAFLEHNKDEYSFYGISLILENYTNTDELIRTFILNGKAPHIFETIPDTFTIGDYVQTGDNTSEYTLQNTNIFNNVFKIDRAHNTVLDKVQSLFTWVVGSENQTENFKIFVDYTILPILKHNDVKLSKGIYKATVKNLESTVSTKRKLAIYNTVLNKLFKESYFYNNYFNVLHSISDDIKEYTKYVYSLYIFLKKSELTNHPEKETLILLFFKLAFIYSENSLSSQAKMILKKLSEHKKNCLYIHFLQKHITGLLSYKSEKPVYLESKSENVIENLDWYLISYIAKYKSYNENYINMIEKAYDTQKHSHKLLLCKGISQFCRAFNRNNQNRAPLLFAAVTSLEEARSLSRDIPNLEPSIDQIYSQFLGDSTLSNDRIFYKNIPKIYKGDLPENNKIRKFGKNN